MMFAPSRPLLLLLCFGWALINFVDYTIAPDPNPAAADAFPYTFSLETSGHANTLFKDVIASKEVNFQECPDYPMHSVVGDMAGSAKYLAECWLSIQPLDHLDPTDTRTINIAVSRLPPLTGINEAHPLWKGFVYFDFGGPGSSTIVDGWQSTSDMYALFQYHTIILRDIRGVGASGPETNCWSNVWDEQIHYQTNYEDSGSMLNGGVMAAERYRKTWMDFADRCTKKLGGKHGILKHIGLAAHARDLVSIHGALCEHYNVPLSSDKVLMNFWGVSWGGTLGHTIANMYPNGVGRTSLTHSDFVSCGGHFLPSKLDCSIPNAAAKHRGWDPHLKHLVGNLTVWKDQLANIQDETTTASDAAAAAAQFPSFGLVDRTALQRGAASAWRRPNDSERPQGWTGYAGWLIRCADAETFGLEDPSAAGIYSLFQKARLISPIGAEQRASRWLSCIGFGSEDKSKEKILAPSTPIKTKNPVLITGLLYDPICPQRNAQGEPYGVKHYEEAHYLEIAGAGHGVRSHLHWVEKYKATLREYLTNAVVPRVRETTTVSTIQPF
ncbi:hypothetical protein BJ508DRAFT_345740 [Ascobolus immersus RN42]|uniref:AB hydrolase-1 domain-containing protein n=1 Tax=Ascobolus immersus RN42 TaxID=1160509 RepID=A0A3N4IC15_ASCIM|nr:hypothetical protein BJ508DRAFT_345740 [Ascobolus immersus RN42]